MFEGVIKPSHIVVVFRNHVIGGVYYEKWVRPELDTAIGTLPS
jgi:hypothetical protein